MKNKKGLISLLIPLFAIFLVLVLSVVGIYNIGAWDDQEATIGEKPQAILQAYAQADAIDIYAQQAAARALQQASNTATQLTLEQETAKIYEELLASYSLKPIYATANVTRQGRELEFELQSPIAIPVSAEKTSVSVSGAGIITRWPVDEPPVITGLFGKRDVNRGSPNHPGLDIRAPYGAPVFSIGPGEVIMREDSKVGVRHENGYICRYVHVGAQVDIGDQVREGQQIAVVIDDGFDAHLDIRCYSHENVLEPQAAVQLLGQEHVGGPYSPPTDTTYAAIIPGAQTYIDPFCLLSTDLQEVTSTKIINSETEQAKLSTLKYRDTSLTVAERLQETCNAYQRLDIIRSNTQVSEYYLDQAVEKILEHEETQCTNDAVDRGGITRYGVTADTLANYRSIPVQEAQNEVCSVTREEAKEIFRVLYLEAPKIDELPTEVVPHVWDMNVLHGQNNTRFIVEQTLIEEGYLPQGTQIMSFEDEQVHQAIRQAISSEAGIHDALVERRKLFMQRIVQNDPSQEKFLERWLNRAESWREDLGVDQRLAQGALLHEITITQRLDDDQLQRVSQRSQVVNELEVCEYRDTSCRERATQSTNYDACREPHIQLPENINSCAQQLETGCSCQFLLSSVSADTNVSFNHQLLRINQTTHPADWIGQEGADSYEVVLGVEDATQQVLVNVFNKTRGQVRFTQLSDGQERTLDPLEDALYMRLETQGKQAIVYFSQQNQSVVCTDQTYTQTYCRGEDEKITVKHPIDAP